MPLIHVLIDAISSKKIRNHVFIFPLQTHVSSFPLHCIQVLTTNTRIHKVNTVYSSFNYNVSTMWIR